MFPSLKSPSVCSGLTGKDQNGLTLVPWQSVKSLCWDVTVSCPLAESYVTEATRDSREAGAAAELAATRKEAKYAGIVGRHMFEPIAVETLGVFAPLKLRPYGAIEINSIIIIIIIMRQPFGF